MSNNSIIYGDTDSAYVSLANYARNNGIDLDGKTAVKLADKLAEDLNRRIPERAAEKFLVPLSRGKILRAARENVAKRGLFKDKKKRYALHVIDKEGRAQDTMKIVGLEIRRSDTPKYVQEFLEQVAIKLVKQNQTYEEIRKYVDEFRSSFRKMEPWRQGKPNQVRNLSESTRHYLIYRKQLEQGLIGAKKPRITFQVSAAINTNLLIELNKETRWDYIRDGDKIEALYLKQNQYQMDKVAIKSGEHYVPDWFKRLPFDFELMEQKLIDQKLYNMLDSVLKWDFSPSINYADDVLEQDEDFYG